MEPFPVHIRTVLHDYLLLTRPKAKN
jgi:hypothetical protein